VTPGANPPRSDMRADTTALLADRIVVGESQRVVRNGVVILRGDRIDGVGTRVDLADQIRRSDVHDFGDATIVPGLIDVHAHTTWPADGSSYETIVAMPEPKALSVAAANLRRHLRSGVTTVRDNGSKGSLGFRARELTGGSELFPRLLVSGPPVTQHGGHMHWCGGPADTPDEIRAAIALLASKGADHVKLVGSGGGTTGTRQHDASYSVAQLRSAGEAAREHGLRTTVHCHATEAVARAAEAGVDCIEHASFMVANPGAEVRQYGAAWTGLKAEFDPDVADLVAERRCFVSATLQGGYGALLELRRKATEEGLNEMESRALAASEEHCRRKVDVAAALWDHGLEGRLVVSTDAGPGNTSFGEFHLALELAVETGMSPVQVIESATAVAAEAVGIDDRVGRLATGMEADVVVVAGDATSHIGALGSVLMVVRAGRVVPGEDEAGGMDG
jgi:imidazolonepropionase-like amidohydrolase